MLEQFVSEVVPELLTILLRGAGIVVAIVLAWALSKGKNWIVSKIGSENYNRGREIAIGLYQLLEDKYPEIHNMGEQKKQEMADMLLQTIPGLTEVELDAINKEVWAMFNKKAEESGLALPVNEDQPALSEEVRG